MFRAAQPVHHRTAASGIDGNGVDARNRTSRCAAAESTEAAPPKGGPTHALVVLELGRVHTTVEKPVGDGQGEPSRRVNVVNPRPKLSIESCMTAPGWYPDVHDPRILRWFDGYRWTQAVQPVSHDGPETALHWMIPIGRSWQSVAAGYAGLAALLAWMFGWMGPGGALVGGAVGTVALALGVQAVRRAAAGGNGRGRAVFAIVAGATCLALTAIMALASA